MADFTIKVYRSLLEAINQSEIKVYGIEGWLANQPDSGILLRHDVDRIPANSLRIARLENDLGISSTYYFRITNNSFSPGIIKQIYNLNHEIGYHYEDLSLAYGNPHIAIKLFDKHLELIRQVAPVKTISMHGKPLSKFDNRELWKNFDYRDYNLSGEAFLSIDYSDIYYFTDTGRCWNGNAPNFRDRVNSHKQANIKTTNDLICFIKDNRNQKIALVTHPERWTDSGLEYCTSYSRDWAVNLAKRVIRLYRN